MQRQKQGKAPNPRGGRGHRHANAPTRKKKRQGRKLKRQKAAGTARNRQRKSCIMQSWERAVFSPRLLGVLYKTGSNVKCESYRMAVSIGRSCIGQIPPSAVFWFCPMRRRSLRLLSPGRLHNSDGDTGAFFRVKNYQREFFARKPQARTRMVSSLRVTFLKRT